MEPQPFHKLKEPTKSLDEFPEQSKEKQVSLQPFDDLHEPLQSKENQIYSQPFDELSAGVISIPKESLYLTSILFPLGGSSEEYNPWNDFTHFCVVVYLNFVQFMIFIINIVAQTSLILYIGFLSDKFKCVTDPVLMWIAAILFYTHIIRDFQESINMFVWIYCFPRSSIWQPLRISVTEPKEFLGGMCLWYKILCVVLFITPKIIIIVILAKYGGSWLMRAQSNQDLILNCVALFFITELDEMFNKHLVPATVSKVVEDIPDIHWPFQENGVAVVCTTIFGTFFTVGLIVGVTAVAYHDNCGFDYVPPEGTVHFFV